MISNLVIPSNAVLGTLSQLTIQPPRQHNSPGSKIPAERSFLRITAEKNQSLLIESDIVYYTGFSTLISSSESVPIDEIHEPALYAAIHHVENLANTALENYIQEGLTSGAGKENIDPELVKAYQRKRSAEDCSTNLLLRPIYDTATGVAWLKFSQDFTGYDWDRQPLADKSLSQYGMGHYRFMIRANTIFVGQHGASGYPCSLLFRIVQLLYKKPEDPMSTVCLFRSPDAGGAVSAGLHHPGVIGRGFPILSIDGFGEMSGLSGQEWWQDVNVSPLPPTQPPPSPSSPAEANVSSCVGGGGGGRNNQPTKTLPISKKVSSKKKKSDGAQESSLV